MSIHFQAEVNDEILFITASGADEDLQDVIDYGQSVIELARRHGVTCVFCDERQLQYGIDTFAIYESAKQIAAQVPRIARVAIVCGEQYFQDGKFWETVAVNRGLHVRIDTDYARVRTWLEQEKANQH